MILARQALEVPEPRAPFCVGAVLRQRESHVRPLQTKQAGTDKVPRQESRAGSHSGWSVILGLAVRADRARSTQNRSVRPLSCYGGHCPNWGVAWCDIRGPCAQLSAADSGESRKKISQMVIPIRKAIGMVNPGLIIFSVPRCVTRAP